MSTRKISVEILADAAQFERQMSGAAKATSELDKQSGHASKSASGLERDLSRAGRGALAAELNFKGLGRSVAYASLQFAGAAGFVDVIKKSIQAGSDLHEELNKTNVVFGENAAAVKAWSKDSATAFGQSRAQALGMASTFGNMLVPMGVIPSKAAEMSTKLVKLAGDMSSFNNASPEETLAALQSGLAGQVRPLRQFGVFLDQNRIKAEALADGIIKATTSTTAMSEAQQAYAIAEVKAQDATAKYGATSTQAAQANLQLQKASDAVAKATAGHVTQLTAEQKALATYQIILKDTKLAQGDFQRTSNGLANQERILQAEFGNLEEEIGTALMPTVLKYTKSLTAWLEESEKNGTIQRDTQEAVHLLTAAIDAGEDVVKVATTLFHGLADAVGGDENAVKALVAAFLIFKGMPVANAIAAVVSRVATIGTGAAVAEGEVGGLRLALMGLGGPEVLGALAAAYAAAKLLENMFHKDTKAPASYGPQLKKGESIAQVQNDVGFYTAAGQTQTEGYFAVVELEKLMQKAGTVISTESQVAQAMKKAAIDVAGIASTSAQDAAAARANVGKGRGTPAAYSVNAGVDLKDENPMIPQALQALGQAGYQVQVTSGYRTEAQQAALWARYRPARFAEATS